MSEPAKNLDSGDQLASLKQEILAAIAAAKDAAALEEVRVHALGKKGRITEQMKTLGALAPDVRKERGAALNVLKDEIAAQLDAKQKTLAGAEMQTRLEKERIDVTLSPRPLHEGRVHPISQTIDEIVTIFGAMGFTVAKGPDIESDQYNFEALNIPPDHPARDMQATFYLPQTGKHPTVLRTQTSPVQIRTMMDKKPPIRIIAPGRTYRCDYDMTHTPMFHQVEGLVIDEATHMGHLKGCLMDFLREFFGIKDLPVRFRPSYFPFTEPSAEVDIGCSRKGGELKLGAGGDWLEILGCGMVHPNVLKNCGIDPEKYQGFAFGMGIERIAMLKYGIPDLRTFFEADNRWLKHYGFLPLDIPNLALKG
ncbi:MAG TPA: phenylalanine--tRNA ligase subunit alpha [Alphaproteobacteria bacterium]|nr:phenylalanine--tRNA ligase subunit alpha [Alphaproteobacteria bacterium]